ncbi:MAG: CoA ester lyase [Candidatus Thermoplasmatota archaeon]|nr:CoA ester lyase [Candidatus Thermoplasmatota archaeon]MCL5788999.1 CoA ester lyase [Candidatus Thermoplasmatota archaeon]
MFTPVLKEGWASKAWQASPDGVILDLEDSIPLDRKKEARTAAAEITREPGLDWFIRINSHASGIWKEDLKVALNENVVGILIPKVESSSQVKEIVDFTIKLMVKKSMSNSRPFFIPILESAKGIMNISDIAGNNKGILTLAFGAADFVRDMGFLSTPDNGAVNTVKFLIAMAARAAGLEPPHDSPYFSVDDEEGLRKEATLAKTLAYGGKHAIHPSQVKVIQDVFRVDPEDLKEARKIIEEFDRANERGIASIKVDGKMVDYPIYHRAKELTEKVEKGD